MSTTTDIVNELSHQSIRAALKSWSNLVKLGCHPLTRLRIVQYGHRHAGRPDTAIGLGLSLRAVLREAIEALRPEAGAPNYADRRWRAYVILKEEFVDGRCPEYVATQLGDMAERTYQEARIVALQRLASVLAEQEDSLSRAEAARPL